MDQLDSVLSQMRDGYSPDHGARRRVRSALATSLAVGVVLGTANVKATAAAVGSSVGAKSISLGKLIFWGKVAVGLGATATVTVAGVHAARSIDRTPESKAVATHSQPAPSVRLQPAELSNQSLIQEQVTLDAPSTFERVTSKGRLTPMVDRKQNGSTRAKSQSVSHPASSTVDEFRLLREASQDLRAGHVAEAQHKLDEHGRRFPSTSLSDERRGLSLLVSCSTGTTKRNRAEAERFVAAAPASPLADSVKRRCLP